MGEKSDKKRKKSVEGEDGGREKKKRVSEGGEEKKKKKSKKSVGSGETPVKAVVDKTPSKPVDASHLSPIAVPLADVEVVSKVFELIKKAAKGKLIRRGIREVAKSIRKGQKGICVFAGDVFPVDVIAHLPLTCEEASIPYCFVPYKESLGNAALTKRPTSVLLVTEAAAKTDYADEYKSCRKSIKELQQE
ncbi:hypothetical protein NDN08_000834 [Rhodosorus marinus]|uniref:H/ACA ribonucleoprotein complex subunit 2 n=1 Tax=Rhodosorus marinus TaxID=101924 RepID=A0AAV8UTC7_9RHOD|nr:hypothetical protein NDN08_000834 [Rhodosorus marinus]